VARFAKQVEDSLVLRAHAWPNARKRRFVKVHPTLLKADGPLPVAIETDVERYLGGRRAALDREIEEVGKLADQDKRQTRFPAWNNSHGSCSYAHTLGAEAPSRPFLQFADGNR
jgi:hypothetical protein